ncbi:hypothetical protein SBV1_3160011 [Verrucomicrobia bacterium]|nr:hypothetical protein SBV1_3160011 [Verrucomicrobiota bacterium]
MRNHFHLLIETPRANLALQSFGWSSYGQYLRPGGRRLAWLRADRLLGEHGIPKDSAAGRQGVFAWVRPPAYLLSTLRVDCASGQGLAEEVELPLASRVRFQSEAAASWLEEGSDFCQAS